MKNLFRHWDSLKKELSDKHIMLFLDYDGTLTPIVSTPDKASISREAKDLLGKLSESPKCKLAIISGRALKDIKNIIGLKEIIYSGNHGLEIEGPKIKFEAPVSLRYKNSLKQIKNNLNKKLSPIKGVFVEDKGLTLSIHYRLASRQDALLTENIFKETASPYLIKKNIIVKSGKKVFEVRPPLKWDKGKVALWLLARQQFALGDNNIFVIYMGDDVTDEDAFKALKDKGLTVFVGRPRPSSAKYCLKDTMEVNRFLKEILYLPR